jgi:sugar lactone lactonase YvrE
MLRALAIALALLVVAPATALAVPDCPTTPTPRALLAGQGKLEAVTANRDALFISNLDQNTVMRLDAPGQAARTLAPVATPGGLVFDRDGSLIAGSGDGPAQGVLGNAGANLSSLLRIDPVTGATSLFAAGLQMANGVARGPDGTFYASNDFGTDGIDRIAGGQVQTKWAKVVSANGLVVDTENRWLYAAQTFQPAAIQRVDLTNPSNVETYATAPAESIAAGPDGMTRDAKNRLYVAANGSGEIWRVDTDRSICALARGLRQPSAVSFGGGGDFPTTSLYAVTFGGDLVELPGATDAPSRPARR